MGGRECGPNWPPPPVTALQNRRTVPTAASWGSAFRGTSQYLAILNLAYAQKGMWRMQRRHPHFPSWQIGQYLSLSHIEPLRSSELPQKASNGVIRAIDEGGTLQPGGMKA